MRILAFLVLWSAFSVLLYASDDNLIPPKIIPPTLIREIKPEYSDDLQKMFLLHRVRIELTVDQEGRPFALKAESGIPDNVVDAFSKWRFKPGLRNGRPVPFDIEVTMPIREALSPAVERNLGRQWHPSAAGRLLSDDLKAGESFDQPRAARTERSVEMNPADVDSRKKLLAYYALSEPNATENRSALLRHILWFVTNQPEADILGSPLVSIGNVDDPSPDADIYRQVRQAWLGYVSTKSVPLPIVEHATNFLRLADPEAAERLLIVTASKSDEAVLWLADLYALNALGVRAVDLKTGRATLAERTVPHDGFGAKARQQLLSATGNTRMLLAGLSTVTAAGRYLAKADHLPQGYSEFCEQLLQRARLVYPNTSASCETGPEASKEDVDIVRVGGKVQEANLVKKILPQYPSDAKYRGIMGTVEFTAVIGADGKIHDLTLLRGPLALYESARDAVSKWEYRPVRLNGRPVAVVTDVVVNYTLGR